MPCISALREIKGIHDLITIAVRESCASLDKLIYRILMKIVLLMFEELFIFLFPDDYIINANNRQ